MSNNENKSISIVIPVYKSEGVLKELHRRLSLALNSLTDDYEIILVNDCSPDKSWEIMNEISKEDKCVMPIALRRNVGYDNAVMAGLNYASKEYVVMMDDDLQHSPEDISLLLDMFEDGYDVVYANFIKKRQALLKNLGSWMNGKLAQLIINKPPDIYLSPFKIMRREIADVVIKYRGPFPYIDGLIFQATSFIGQVTITHNERFTGKGNHGIYRSMKIVFNFCTTFSVLPLRLATLLGLVFSCIAGIAGIVLVLSKLVWGVELEGWTSIMLCIVIMGGIQLVVLGIIGEYVGRLYMNINHRPQFVVKEKSEYRRMNDGEN